MFFHDTLVWDSISMEHRTSLWTQQSMHEPMKQSYLSHVQAGFFGQRTDCHNSMVPLYCLKCPLQWFWCIREKLDSLIWEPRASLSSDDEIACWIGVGVHILVGTGDVPWWTKITSVFLKGEASMPQTVEQRHVQLPFIRWSPSPFSLMRLNSNNNSLSSWW